MRWKSLHGSRDVGDHIAITNLLMTMKINGFDWRRCCGLSSTNRSPSVLHLHLPPSKTFNSQFDVNKADRASAPFLPSMHAFFTVLCPRKSSQGLINEVEASASHLGLWASSATSGNPTGQLLPPRSFYHPRATFTLRQPHFLRWHRSFPRYISANSCILDLNC